MTSSGRVPQHDSPLAAAPGAPLPAYLALLEMGHIRSSPAATLVVLSLPSPDPNSNPFVGSITEAAVSRLLRFASEGTRLWECIPVTARLFRAYELHARRLLENSEGLSTDSSN